ncbi:phosphotransferase [Candidatus Pelagibacter sp.]|nr:phosphotransferase [Candidatus Pelagibacter sp.]
MKFSKELKKIKGDASFRKFYRNKKKKTIIVFAKKEKRKNLLVYDAINRILIKNKLKAPKLFHENYKNNFIEIEDFGSKTLFEVLGKKKNNFYMFKKIIQVLNKIQSIKEKKTKDFYNNNYILKKYYSTILFDETNLFCKWYVPKILPKKKIKKFNEKFRYEIKELLSSLNYKNDTFVHRDFHVSNLMYDKNKICIIDSQDALIGNRAYDLASLIDDVRFKTSNLTKNKIYKEYLKTNKKIDKKKFKLDFDILSVLRNLKIIGIFTRLAIRDNKKEYIRLIPYAWRMISFRMNENKIFYKLSFLLETYFPKYMYK